MNSPTRETSLIATWQRPNSNQVRNVAFELFTGNACTSNPILQRTLVSLQQQEFTVAGNHGVTYYFQIVSYDTKGNAHRSPCSNSLEVDIQAPKAPVVQSSNPLQSTASRRPTWSWKSSDASGVGEFRYKLGSSNFDTDATTTRSTEFVPTEDLPDGLHTLFVSERDRAGNWSEAGRAQNIIDGRPPGPPRIIAVLPQEGRAGYVNTAMPSIYWSSAVSLNQTETVTHQCQVDNGAWENCQPATLQGTLETNRFKVVHVGNEYHLTFKTGVLGEGARSFRVRAQSSAGTISPADTDTTGLANALAQFTIDTVRPETKGIVTSSNVANEQMPDKFHNIQSAITFSWGAFTDANGIASYQCKLDRIEPPADQPWAQCQTNSSMQISLPAADGYYRFSVRAIDIAGNASNSLFHNLKLDRTPPEKPAGITSGTHPSHDRAFTEPNPHFTWTPGRDEHLDRHEYNIEREGVSPNTTWTKTPGPLAVTVTGLTCTAPQICAFNFKLRAVDEAGNISDIATYRFLIDPYCTDSNSAANVLLTQNGAGTSANPYKVCSASQLAELADGANADLYWNKTIEMRKDIDLSAGPYPAESIGVVGFRPFSGTFDGKNHVISYWQGASGVFGHVGGTSTQPATVKNVIVDSANVGSTLRGEALGGLVHLVTPYTTISNAHIRNSQIEGYAKVGGLIGETAAPSGSSPTLTSTTLRIDNCSASVNISGSYQVGGLIGLHGFGWIYSSSAAGEVSIDPTTRITSYDDFGGLAGSTDTYGFISNSSAEATLNGDTKDGTLTVSWGGLVGTNNGKIYRSRVVSNSAVIKGKFQIGGLVGQNANGIVHQSMSRIEVRGRTFVGGLVGTNGGYVSESFSDSHVLGDHYVGGIAGQSVDVITNSYVSGATVLGVTTSDGDYVGGIVGSNGQNLNAEGIYIVNSLAAGTINQQPDRGPSTASLCSSAGRNHKGGLAGCVVSEFGQINSFWDTTRTGLPAQSPSFGEGLPFMPPSTYANLLGSKGWNFQQIWTISAERPHPFFMWEAEEPLYAAPSGCAKIHYDRLGTFPVASWNLPVEPVSPLRVFVSGTSIPAGPNIETNVNASLTYTLEQDIYEDIVTADASQCLKVALQQKRTTQRPLEFTYFLTTKTADSPLTLVPTDPAAATLKPPSTTSNSIQFRATKAGTYYMNIYTRDLLRSVKIPVTVR